MRYFTRELWRHFNSLVLTSSLLMLSCGNPERIYPVSETDCTNDCEGQDYQGGSATQPESVCSDLHGDVYKLAEGGTLGELIEDCSNEQICLGSQCATVGEFAFNSNWGGELEVYLQDGYEGEPRRITDTDENSSFLFPAFSLDGKKIVLNLNQGAYSNLYLIDLMENTIAPLTQTTTYFNMHPTFSPDGQWVVFSSTRDGNYNLWKMRTDRSDLTQLTYLTTESDQAAVDPYWCASNWIVYRCDFENSELCKIRPDGSEWTRLTFNERGADGDPACSPNGMEVAFSSWRKNHPSELLSHQNIFVMDINGENERRITNDEEHNAYPAWSRDGRLIGYDSGIPGERKLVITNSYDGREKLVLVTNTGDNSSVSFR